METSRIRHCLAGLLLATLVSFGAVGTASADAGIAATVQTQASRTSAAITFQVVIPEVVTFGASVQRQPATAPALTRTVSMESGIRLVTVARP